MRAVDKPLLNSFEDISKIRNREDTSIRFLTDTDTTLRDFYWKYARGIVATDSAKYPSEKAAIIEPADQDTRINFADKHICEVSFSNKGGLVMPIILEWTYADGTKEIERIPAQIWRKNEVSLSKLFVKQREATALKLDPFRETADVNLSNNSWPNVGTVSKFQLFKQKQQVRGQSSGGNPMQKAMGKEGKKAF